MKNTKTGNGRSGGLTGTFNYTHESTDYGVKIDNGGYASGEVSKQTAIDMGTSLVQCAGGNIAAPAPVAPVANVGIPNLDGSYIESNADGSILTLYGKGGTVLRTFGVPKNRWQ